MGEKCWRSRVGMAMGWGGSREAVLCEWLVDFSCYACIRFLCSDVPPSSVHVHFDLQLQLWVA